jgi:hypothetical protein
VRQPLRNSAQQELRPPAESASFVIKMHDLRTGNGTRSLPHFDEQRVLPSRFAVAEFARIPKFCYSLRPELPANFDLRNRMTPFATAPLRPLRTAGAASSNASHYLLASDRQIQAIDQSWYHGPR